MAQTCQYINIWPSYEVSYRKMVIFTTKQSQSYVWSKGKDDKSTCTPQLSFIPNQLMYFHLENSISWSTTSYFMAPTPQITLPSDLCFFCPCLIFMHTFYEEILNLKSRFFNFCKFHMWYIVNISNLIYLFVCKLN